MAKDGPAFPTELNTQPGFYAHHGMSLRDWFAGQALPAVITMLGPKKESSDYVHGAYLIADRMISMSEKERKNA